MKKLFLLSIAAGISAVAFGQGPAITAAPFKTPVSLAGNNIAAKTTAVGDTFTIPLFTSADTFAIYNVGSSPYDSGFATGTNPYGHKAFAQRYDVKASDSTVKVIGVYGLFGGKISPTSTKTVSLNVWSQGPKTTWARPTLFNSGFPNTVLASKTVNITALGIGLADTANDTFKSHMFATPTAILTQNFFVGYEINYSFAALAGDTIGLYSSRQGNRTAPAYFAYSTTDTTINNYNATKYSDNVWHDNVQDGFNLYNKLYIRPIVVIHAAVINGVSVTNRQFTFYGNYPNPAINSTNIRFALAEGTDVTIQVMDMAGRVVSTISKTGLAAGEHTVALETANLAAGDYIYVMNTANGDGMASKLTVIK
ncbi:MAG: T9SS type A sorting domain-containing protein [Bacteroidota bacterium]